MTTEKLIIQLDADTKKLDAGLKSTDKNLDSLDKSTKKNDASLKGMTVSAASLGKGMLSVGTAVLAAKAAVDAMVLSSAKARIEIELLSKQAKLSVEDFQALAFATKQYGINAEQVADISKDVADRLGEFATAGTGTFQDFLDVMGMTKAEGMELAKEFQDLSSDQVIGEMVKRMEEAGASGNQMTFVLESMGNDLSKLAPLFANNSEELNKLTGAYSAANKEFSITAEQSTALKQVSTDFDLMTGSISNATTEISATLAPALSEFFNSVIEVVPDATQKIIDFINSFQSAENIKSIADMDTQIENLQTRAEALSEYKGVSDVFGSVTDIAKREELVGIEERLGELYAARLELAKEIQETEGADRSGGGDISGGSGGSGDGGGTSGAITSELQALEDSFKTQEEMLHAKYEKDLALAEGQAELLKEVENKYIEDLMALDEENVIRRAEASHELWLETIAEQNQEKFDLEISEQQRLLDEKLINEEQYLKSVNDIAIKYGKSQQKNNKKTGDEQELTLESGLQTAISVNNALFENNKGLEAGLVVAKTGTAVMHQLESGDPYTAFARAAAAGATGAVQLASVLSATNSGGGGSISSPSSSSPSSSQPSVTGEVEINESIGGGGQVSSTSNTVTITAEDGDELAEAFASVMNKKINSGEITLG